VLNQRSPRLAIVTSAPVGRMARLRALVLSHGPAPQARGSDGTPPTADGFIALVASAWLVALVYAATQLSATAFVHLLPIIVMTALIRRLNVGLYASETFVSVSVIGNLSAGIVGGVPGAVACSSLAIFAGMSFTHLRLRRVVFNGGAVSLSNALAAILFHQISAVVPGSSAFAQVPAAVIAACATYLTESSFVALIVLLTQGKSPRRLWAENFRWLLPYWMMFGAVALGLVETYERAGLLGLLAFAGPALLMRYTMKQYVDRTARSVKELSTRNAELEQANQEIADMSAALQETYIGTLEALVAALDARDRETYGHSTRVSQLTAVLAREYGIKEGTPEFLDIERGALLHDVGKIGVPDAILRKPGKLTEAEWVDMRQHARIGYDVLKDVPFLAGASTIVAAHHERWDGQGYPMGLAGEEIPLGARMFMLADTFDAMCTDRPYRRARSYEEARAELVRCAGTQFDPYMVELVQRVFPQWVDIHRAGLKRAEERTAAETANVA